MAAQSPIDRESRSGSTTRTYISEQAFSPNLSDSTTADPTPIAVELCSHAWRPFAARSIAVGIAVCAAALYLPEFPPWAVASCVFVLSIAIMLPGIYIATLRRLHENTLFRQGGMLYKLRTKRFLLTVLWFAWSTGVAFYTLLQLNMFSAGEWAAFFCTIPIVYIAYHVSHRFLALHVHALHVHRMALSWTRTLAPLATLIILIAVVWQLESAVSDTSLQETVLEKRKHLAQSHGSALVDEALQLVAGFAGAKEYIERELGALSSTLSRSLTVASYLMVGYASVSLLSCLLIPRTEYRRLFGSLTHELIPSPLKPGKIAYWSAIIVFVYGFIFIYGFVGLETGIHQNPQWRAERQRIEAIIYTEVDEIDGKYFEPGTIRKIQEARANSIRATELALSDLEQTVDAAFDAMERNVDPYLDWYYSLPAEYARMTLVLTGNIEENLASNLREHLNQGDPFNDVSAKIDGVIQSSSAATEGFEIARATILRNNAIVSPDNPVRVVARLSKAELDFSLADPAAAHIEARMAGAGAASVVTGLITAKVVGKVVGKSAFKLAAKGASKVAISKAGGAAGGAAVGAAIGSVFPGLGTLIGGAIGAVAGVAIGFSVDYALINLEEFVSRDSFRAELLGAISEARVEYKAHLFPENLHTTGNNESQVAAASRSESSNLVLAQVVDGLRDAGAQATILERDADAFWIESEHDDLLYYVYLDECDQSGSCAKLQFEATFLNFEITDAELEGLVSRMENIDAAFDDEGDEILQMSVNLIDGSISESNLASQVGYWHQNAELFYRRIRKLDPSY